MKTLKTKLASALLVAGILLTATLWPKAQAEPRHEGPAAVIMAATETYQNNLVSYSIYSSQSSPSAPEIKLGTPLADALEYLMQRGFRVQSSEGFVFVMLREQK